MTGCTGELDDTRNNKEIHTNVTHLSNETKLKHNIEDLIKNDETTLEIKQSKSCFIKSSDYFTKRILELLSLKEQGGKHQNYMDNYDICLRFSGYKDIYIYKDMFWFEGEEDVYIVEGLWEQWSRYIIKYQNDELYYDSFERSTLSSVSAPLDSGASEVDAQLFYDGSLRLKVEDIEVLLKPFVPSYKTFKVNYGFYSRRALYDLILIKPNGWLGVYKDMEPRAVDGCELDLYSYQDGEIQQLWSTNELFIESMEIQLDNGIINFHFPFMEKEYSNQLSKEEVKQIHDQGNGYSEGKLTQKNVTLIHHDISFIDDNKDGVKELKIVSRTDDILSEFPVDIYVNIVFTFSLAEEGVICTNIVLE